MRTKPKNMKYTDLCIYIDKTVYERDEHNNPTGLREMSDPEITTVYNYLYALIYALAMKKRLMNSKEEYEMFCLDTATNVFLRLRKENQDYSGEASRNKCIKSILNYVKFVLPKMAITWKDNNYFQTLKPDYHSEKEVEGIKKFTQAQVTQQYTEERASLYQELLQNIPFYLKSSLEKSVFKKNALEKHQLLLSEYASLCNCLTLTNDKKELTKRKKEKLILEQFKRKQDFTISLSESPMITPEVVDLQLRKGLFLMENTANDIKRDTTPSDEEIYEILSSALTTYDTDQSGD